VAICLPFTKIQDYLKLRRILRDGERLQKIREQIGEEVFERRLKRLKKRLENFPYHVYLSFRLER
jgi:hypothetical protein